MKKYFMFILTILLALLSVNAIAETNYLTILTFGEYGNRPGEFNYPVCLTLDKDNNLYVSDWENDRIQKFSSNGRLLKVIPEVEGEDALKLDGPGEIPLANLERKNNIVGLVSPHAGYMYSGPVAANGFYKIALDGKPDTIIILGPNHRGFGEDISIMAEGKWETPLGELKIDTDIAESILKNSKIIKNDNKAHQFEHSIEVQLPFIQYIFGKNIKFVPICMTRQDINTDIEIAKSICSSVIGKNILIIASSDFTHYEPQKYAENVDKQAINAIIEFNPKKLYDMVYHQNLTMCGPGPITVMLN